MQLFTNPYSRSWSLRLVLFSSLFTIVTSACTHTPSSPAALYFSQVPTERDPKELVARSNKAMVVTAHPLASAAGLEVLRKGGNAVDAMAAASFAVSVVRPQSTGIGGGGFMLLYDPKLKKTKAYDFRERAPLKASRDMYIDEKGNPIGFQYQGQNIPRASLNGHLAAGTPGLVHGVVEVHKEYGRLSLAEVMAPAIRLAEEGFPVYASLASAMKRRQEVLEKFPATKAIFFRNDKPLEEGDVLVQKDLAWSLQQIAKNGHKAFYQGEIADRIVAEMKRAGGLISKEDLTRYRTIRRQALRSKYRDYEIVTMPPPSSGGVHISQMLNILEGYDIGKLGFSNKQYYNYLIEAMRYAYSDRAHYLADTDFVDVPVQALISKDYARQIREKIEPGKAADSLKIGRTKLPTAESPSTTHLTVMDASGMVISSTQTVNYLMGSGAVVPGTGMILNDEMDDFSIRPGLPNAYGLVGNQANEIAPRKTMLSSMTPTIIFTNDRPYMALGSPGGSRIINTILQVIIHNIDFKMSLPQAVHSPRIHHQWLPDKVWVESPALDSVAKELQSMGYKIEHSPMSVGDIQAIQFDGKEMIGVSDSRSDGVPLGL
ncbi:MAG: gamma-glutamyltransferase [Oligoflexus sp.]